MLAASSCDSLSLAVAAALKTKHEDLHITSAESTKGDVFSMDSITLSGLSIEVGPLAHGTLRHGLLTSTRELVSSVLDAIEAHNQRLLALLSDKSLRDRVRVVTPDNSAWTQQSDAKFELVKIYSPLKPIEFPTPGALAQKWVVHPSLDGSNFKSLQPGDPLFISTDGEGAVLPFAHDSTSAVVTVFVNEAAYKDRNIALHVYEEKLVPNLLPISLPA